MQLVRRSSEFQLKDLLRITLAIFFVLAFSGCDLGYRELKVSEYGIRLRKLPAWMGGGVSDAVIRPGEIVLVMPWDEVFTLDTKEKTIAWGKEVGDGQQVQAGYVHTRAIDGNEIALAVTVRYAVSDNPEKIKFLFQNVARTDSEVFEIVSSVARADIRTYMNELTTSSFLAENDNEQQQKTSPRYEQMELVRNRMAERLGPWGIEVREVSLNNHKFERQLNDGSIDSSYEQKIEEIERLEQETERERLRIASIRQKKREEFNRVQAEVNRELAEANGYEDQATYKGDSYLEARSNEAKAIQAAGLAEVEGIIEKAEALSGPGGEELLKIELVKNLIASKAKFIVLGSDGEGRANIDVNRLDTNDLIEQLGLIEGLSPDSRPPVQKPREEGVMPQVRGQIDQ